MSVIHLSSSYCKDQFPENHGGSFYNTLNQKLHLETGNWHVGLAEVLYEPNSWDNVREGHNTIQYELWDYPIYIRTPIIKWVEEYSMHPPGKMAIETYRISVKYVAGRRVEDIVIEPEYIDSSKDFFRFKELLSIENDVKYYKVSESNVVHENGYFFDRLIHENIPISLEESKKKWLPARREGGKYRIQIYVNDEHDIGPPVMETVKLQAKNYEKIGELINEFNIQIADSIDSLTGRISTNSLRYHYPPEGRQDRLARIPHIAMVRDRKKVLIQFEATWLHKTKIKIRLHPSLAYQLGYSAYIGYDIGWQLITNTTSQNHYRWEATREFDLNRSTLYSICVFCNIIESIMVGDKQMPLMRYLPVDDTTNQIPLSLFMSMTYNKVNKGSVNAIKIWLTEDIFGGPIKFHGDVHVKLLFEHR